MKSLAVIIVVLMSVVTVHAASPNAATSGKAHVKSLSFYQDEIECETLLYEKSEDAFIQYFQSEAKKELSDYQNFCHDLDPYPLHDYDEAVEVETIGLGTYGKLIENFYQAFLNE